MKPVRRWRWQFSIRSLLVATTGIGLVLAVGLAVHQRGVRQHRAVDELRKLGGGWLFEIPSASAVTLTPPTHLDFCFRSVTFVGFGGAPINDEQLTILREFPRLKMLRLDQCSGITDRSVPVLQSLMHLDHMYLCGTSISDEAVERLRVTLPDCEVVAHVSCRCQECRQFFLTRNVMGEQLCPDCNAQ